jgi:hypothetical protein
VSLRVLLARDFREQIGHIGQLTIRAGESWQGLARAKGWQLKTVY